MDIKKETRAKCFTQKGYSLFYWSIIKRKKIKYQYDIFQKNKISVLIEFNKYSNL